MKYRDLIKQIEADGWYVERTIGNHIQYRHPTKVGTITVPAGGKHSKEVPPGTLNSILKQAGLK
ncbi:MAG: type II toxin-antitoxin system HicA family toxin [Planctomycetota bacterium]|jgi:predicted RNA binding protein YcfA (HicA-like mRNA interferase family)